MQTSTACQFQTAFLGVVRAMPTAATLLRQSLAQWLGLADVQATDAELASPAVSNALSVDTQITPPSGLCFAPLPKAPGQQLLYCLPALCLNLFPNMQGAGDGQVSGNIEAMGRAYPWMCPEIYTDLARLQIAIATLMNPPGASRHHRAIAAQLLGRLRTAPAEAANWPSDDWYALALQAARDPSLTLATGNLPPEANRLPSPVITALRALLVVSECGALTTQLAQVMACEHGTEPEISGAIAAFLAGLWGGQPLFPKTAVEKNLQPSILQLSAAWAGHLTASPDQLPVLPNIHAPHRQ